MLLKMKQLKQDIVNTKEEYNPKIELSKEEVIKIDQQLKENSNKQIQNSQSTIDLENK